MNMNQKQNSNVLRFVLTLVLALCIMYPAIRAEAAEYYPVWVGEHQVTDDNKDDIPVAGGTASYDPETNTLTLNNVTGVEGVDPDHNSMIYSGQALNIVANGGLSLESPYAYNGIIINGDLTIVGDVNINIGEEIPDGSYWVNYGTGVYASNVYIEGNVEIKTPARGIAAGGSWAGSISIYGDVVIEADTGIYAQKDITVDGDIEILAATTGIEAPYKLLKVSGNVKSIIYDYSDVYRVAIRAGKMEIEGDVEAEARNYAIQINNGGTGGSTDGSITVGGNITATAHGEDSGTDADCIAIWADGPVTVGGSIYADGEQEGVSCGHLKAGGDVYAKGGIHAAGIDVNGNLEASGAMWAVESITADIIIGGNVKATAYNDDSDGIVCGTSISVQGDVDVIAGLNAIYVYNDGPLYVGGNVNALTTGTDTDIMGGFAIVAGSIDIEGNVEAEALRIAIYAYNGKAVLNGDRIDVKADYYAISAKTGIDFPSGQCILLPRNGYIEWGELKLYEVDNNERGYIVHDPENGTNAKHVIIGQPEVYAEEVTISEAEVTAGETVQMSAEVYPLSADNTNVNWHLENYYDEENKIERASIDTVTGHLTAQSAGRVTVVAESADGNAEARNEVIIRFKDVLDPGTFWYEPVYWALDKGITYGIQNTNTGFFQTFGHARQCTRAQMVTFLWRMVGCPEPAGEGSGFTDVTDETAYYYKAVQWAAEEGITVGYTDGTFRPQGKCLRRQAVMFLWRLAGEPEPEYTGTGFTDVPEKVRNSAGEYEDNIWYKPIMWANENGIALGYDSGKYAGTFQEGGDCLRRQMVTFLYRYDQKFGKDPGILE
ncbi:MAG: S-layer homology domain-containing protein [Lachnospiraceae bacterium]|nr:S-layer homology domain-containing protein [Lachnospiraceae bacterium]